MKIHPIHYLLLYLLPFLPSTLSNIYLPTTTLTNPQSNVVDIFRTISYQTIQEQQTQLSDERYFNLQLSDPTNQTNHLKCLYLISFASQPTPMQRTALTLLLGSESNIIQTFPDYTFLIWTRRATAAAALVGIPQITYAGKFVGKYKYTKDLLQAVAAAANQHTTSFDVLLTLVPSTNLGLFSANAMLMASTLMPIESSRSSPAIIGTILVVRKNTLHVSFVAKVFQNNWLAIKKLATYCEVVQITASTAATSPAAMASQLKLEEKNREGRSMLRTNNNNIKLINRQQQLEEVPS